MPEVISSRGSFLIELLWTCNLGIENLDLKSRMYRSGIKAFPQRLQPKNIAKKIGSALADVKRERAVSIVQGKGFAFAAERHPL